MTISPPARCSSRPAGRGSLLCAPAQRWPALQRLLNVVRSGGIEQVVIYRLDRLSRNLRHFTTLFEELGEHKVALEIVTAPGMGNAAMDKLMLNVLGSFAEFERDLAASRIAEARAHLKAHGRRIAGATPFGYFARNTRAEFCIRFAISRSISRTLTFRKHRQSLARWADLELDVHGGALPHSMVLA